MLEIRQIQPHQIEQAQQVVATVSLEIWQDLLTAADIKRYDSMSDVQNLQFHYFDCQGVFLVLLNLALSASEQVVGTGAIRWLNPETCELKRMWFLKAYRGQGWGRKMAQMLFDFARQVGYQKVRLDLASKERQPQAMRFYTSLGFYPIERYNEGSCTVFMERLLKSGPES